MIINGNKTGWNKGDKGKKLKHFTVPKCHVPNTVTDFYCHVTLCTLTVLRESMLCSLVVRFLQNVGTYPPNDTQLYITFQKTMMSVEHKSNNI